MPQMNMAPLLAGKEGQCVSNLQRYFTKHLHLDASSIAHPARHTCHTGQNGNHRKNAAVHHYAGAILRPSPKGMVRKNTLNVAVQVPTEESGALLCPNSGAGRGVSTARRNGLGRGAVVRKAIGVATFTFLTPRHRLRVRPCPVVYSVHVGTETMNQSTTTPTSGNINHDHIALTQHATNALSMALWHIRQSTDDDSIRKACGRAVSAARSLKRLAGGASHV